MGLDDLLPDDADTTSRSSSQQSSKDYSVEVGSGSDEVKLTEEKWEGVKKILTEEFGLVPNEVLNKPSGERYEILTEAAQVHEGHQQADESEHRSGTRCYYCGKSCEGIEVEIGGELFCPHHTVAQIEKSLK